MKDGLEYNYVTINTTTIFRFFLIAILLVAIYYLFDIFIVLMAAVVIASALEPVIRKLKKYRIHRVVAVVGIYLLLGVIFAVTVLFFFPLIANDLVAFLNTVPHNISFEDILGPIRDFGLKIGPLSEDLSSRMIPISEFIKNIQTMVIGSGGAFKATSMIFGGLLSFILIVVLSFYLAVKEDGLDDFLRIITPVKRHDYIIDLWKRSQRKIGYWLQGQVLLGIIIGVLVYIILSIVGIPHALVLAVLAGLLEIIPIFGPIISAVPAVLIAFNTAGVGKGMLVIILYLMVHQFENHLFYPLVVRKVVGISPIIIILALVVGAKIAGILGALVAVPLSAAFMEYINDIEKDKKAQKLAGA